MVYFLTRRLHSILSISRQLECEATTKLSLSLIAFEIFNARLRACIFKVILLDRKISLKYRRFCQNYRAAAV